VINHENKPKPDDRGTCRKISENKKLLFTIGSADEICQKTDDEKNRKKELMEKNERRRHALDE
jgi:hypothetical protein